MTYTCTCVTWLCLHDVIEQRDSRSHNTELATAIIFTGRPLYDMVLSHFSWQKLASVAMIGCKISDWQPKLWGKFLGFYCRTVNFLANCSSINPQRKCGMLLCACLVFVFKKFKPRLLACQPYIFIYWPSRFVFFTGSFALGIPPFVWSDDTCFFYLSGYQLFKEEVRWLSLVQRFLYCPCHSGDAQT